MHVHVSEIFVDSSVFTTNVQRDTGDESNELSEAISINHLDIYIFITSSIEEHSIFTVSKNIVLHKQLIYLQNIYMQHISIQSIILTYIT